jgi:Pyruvate/2-oxoacid:ferredoxin oxidoreductase gamma subunit
MKFSILKITFLFILATNCKTLGLDQAPYTKTTQQVPLGSIGSDKDFFLQQNYNNTAIPKYVEPIKLSVSIKSFNKQSFKNFIKAKFLQSAEVNINYIDSVANKPKYIELQLADNVAIVNAFNAKDNERVKNYLSHNEYANVVTGISLALNKNELEKIATADAVFLIENTHKTYVLQLYKENKKGGTIHFNQGIVFSYIMANCCWQENKKYQIDIVDIVNKNNNCPKKTYRSAKRAKKTINYYKL